jgi:hypothetical protein
MNRFVTALIALGMAATAGAASAQTAQSRPQAPPAAQPHAFQPPTSYGNRVSPFGHDGNFPSNRFLTEVWIAKLTRQASYAHIPEVDAANAASVLIDRGDCPGARALLQARGEAAMAARVAATCEAKRRGLI